MDPAGMVHALELTHILIKPGGALIDIHPTAIPPEVAVRAGSESQFAGCLAETDDFIEYKQASAALEEVIKGGLFAREESDQFVFIIHAESFDELRGFLAENWKDAVLTPEVAARAAALEGDKQGEKEILLSEQIHIARLRRK